MGKKEKASAAVVGFDVGKSSHRACAVAPDGAALFNREVANRPGEIDRALADAGPGARVVVDQKRNIGALVVARARAAGNPVFYLPGIAMKKARDMFPATAKTDEIDAEVIARTAMGMPWTLREVAEIQIQISLYLTISFSFRRGLPALSAPWGDIASKGPALDARWRTARRAVESCSAYGGKEVVFRCNTHG